MIPAIKSSQAGPAQPQKNWSVSVRRGVPAAGSGPLESSIMAAPLSSENMRRRLGTRDAESPGRALVLEWESILSRALSSLDFPSM
jgi:hypothetical protein